ncbi:hypothetical protein SLS53_004412 [Cytospora paraplurivora]|uniref:Uncharacterized protein n=1 Tax=Cytospora paraplurivora TaxID=2898453 RepID=A0AAN9YHI1_9PEZI
MQSLLTVNNNVSLLSVTIAPSTFLASLTLLLVFLALYLPPLRFRSGRSTSPAINKGNYNYKYDYDYDYKPNYDHHGRDNAKSHGNRFASYFNNTWFPRWISNRAPDPSIELRNHPPLIADTVAIEDDRRRSRSDTEADLSEMESSTVSAGGYSPPAWRRLGNGDRSSGFWRKGDNLLGYGGLPPQGRRSMESSPEYDSADESLDDEEILAAAIRTRLPTGSINIRFAVRAEVQQRTEPIEAAVNLVRSTYRRVTKSWSSIILSTLVAFMSIAATRALFEPAYGRPVPDLVKVAGIARSFEPLIYYSENGVAQVGDLQATGVAVWDLGESVRLSNLTSAPIIVKELDELSDSLKTLAIELTKFFANVDGDIDGILIVMDWARRELSQVASLPNAPLTSAFDNIHTILSTAGVLETPSGTPTRLGAIATSVFGMSNPQRTRQTLQRTFNEFLAVLEEAINNELQHSLALFGLFESIDHQFLNLARTVVRESNAQDELHADLLSSLWTRILGPKASDVKKYERNRLLLQNVREKTVRNKGILIEHNHKLLALKANLESLRRKLVSPLVRSVNSSTLTVDEQIRGLEDVGIYLEGVRSRQKGKLMEMLYGSVGGGRQERLIDQTG